MSSKAVSDSTLTKASMASLEQSLSHLHTSELETVMGFREKIAFLTSGGDSSGMNAAIRAIVRMSIHCGAEPFAVHEGYTGLVYDKIASMGWNDVANLLSEGGTAIKTSRCNEFMDRSCRKQGAYNLIKRGICKLIVIGGDGSLSGADRLREEWPQFVEELYREQKIPAVQRDLCRFLSIVGMAGSIDNDMCGTEITIGANSSLHRIVEAVDSISSTASSHSRAFVIEVMGRNCGWLALNAWIAVGADWLFIPERPPQPGWEDVMCQTLNGNRGLGKTTTTIIVAEGAIDSENNRIRPDYVQNVVSERLGLDCRVTTLGHVQRGGVPSAFDRLLATLQGVEAVQAILEEHDESLALLIGVNQNKITRKPLMECVTQTKSVARAISEKDFDRAFQLRDPFFKVNYLMTQSLQIRHVNIDERTGPSLKVGLINVGAPAGGMNTANRAVVHYCLSQGHQVLGIFNGFRGLQQDEVRPLLWADVDAWVNKGGSEIGTNRSLPDEDLGQVACQMQRYGLDAMILIGGFEAFQALLQLARARSTYPAFGIPMICLPATVSNNVPGTEFSIGSDTALNSIMDMCDCIKQSASSSRKRLFVVDVQGGYCGYLATLSCLISGGTYSYIHEEGVRLEDLLRESRHLKGRFAEDKRQGRIIIRNEFCSNTYSAEVMSSIFEEEAEGLFDSRWVSLGHVVQGGRPSPLDRVRATRLAVMAVNYIEAFLCPSALHDQALRQFEAVRDRELAKIAASHGNLTEGLAGSPSDDLGEKVHALLSHSRHLAAAVIGIHGPEVEFNSAAELAEINTNMKLRIPRHQWWMPLRKLSRVLAKYKDSQ